MFGMPPVRAAPILARHPQLGGDQLDIPILAGGSLDGLVKSVGHLPLILRHTGNLASPRKDESNFSLPFR